MVTTKPCMRQPFIIQATEAAQALYCFDLIKSMWAMHWCKSVSLNTFLFNFLIVHRWRERLKSIKRDTNTIIIAWQALVIRFGHVTSENHYYFFLSDCIDNYTVYWLVPSFWAMGKLEILFTLQIILWRLVICGLNQVDSIQILLY